VVLMGQMCGEHSGGDAEANSLQTSHHQTRTSRDKAPPAIDDARGLPALPWDNAREPVSRTPLPLPLHQE
jgi:hypothetical protein